MMKTQTDLFLYYDGLTQKYGYKDIYRQIIIPAQFSYAFEFKEGLALVVCNFKLGFINEKGETIIPYIYAIAHDFHEGLAAVSLNSEQWGYINQQGVIIFPFELDYAGNFKRGVAKVSKNKEWKLLQKEGEIINIL